MITYDYAMIATGNSIKFDKPYSQIVIDFINSKNLHNNAKVHLTTNDNVCMLDNTIQYRIDDRYVQYHPDSIDIDGRNGSYFNYNLKFLAIKNAFENTDSDYIIYVDGDFLFTDNYTEEKMQMFLQNIVEKEYDLTPSTMSIGHRDAYDHKYEALNLKNIDNLPTFEENFLAIKKTEKVKAFLEKWEELYWILENKSVRQFHEGLEIGISVFHSNMKIPPDRGGAIDVINPLRQVFWTMDSPTEKGYRF